MSKCKNLTSGMVVTEKQTDCRMTIDEDGCMQYVVVTPEPNPADPEKPIVTYTINGVDVPKPDVLLPCLEPGNTIPVYIMGGCAEAAPVPQVVPACFKDPVTNTNRKGFLAVTNGDVAGAARLFQDGSAVPINYVFEEDCC